MSEPFHPDNPQCVERYIWSVRYKDGSIFEEYPSPTEHRSFHEVVADSVTHLFLNPNHWLNCEGSDFVVAIPENGRPIMFRRNAIRLEQMGQGGSTHARYHLFGYQETIKIPYEERFMDRGGNWQKRERIAERNVKTVFHLLDEDGANPVFIANTDLQVG